MFFAKSFSLVARGRYPKTHHQGMPPPTIPEFAEQAIPYVAKAKNMSTAIRQCLDRVKPYGGVTFAVYHVPGSHTNDELMKTIRSGAFAFTEPVWHDKSQLRVYDLLADYYVGEGKFKTSQNDRLKLTAFTISDAVTAARNLISSKKGMTYAIHHIIGNRTVEELEDISGGSRGSVARLVWFDEDEALSSLTYEEVMEALNHSEAMTQEECFAINLLYEMAGPDSPGVLIPPTLLKREFE